MKPEATKFPEFRKDRADEILAMIESDPSCWDQEVWHCGTSHCFGGWAQIKSGRPADFYTVRRDARLWLGITAYEANRLFSTSNTLEDIRRIISEISDGYDREGYDLYGYDRYGFNRCGYDRFGRDRDGLKPGNLE